eukprot:SAG11_NODE_50_length_19992_cov_9.945157_17_plen_61_part_00
MAAAAPASESSAVDTAAAIALGAGGPPAQSGDAAIAAARTLFDMPEVSRSFCFCVVTSAL